MARKRCYTRPCKAHYECPVCGKPMTIRRCKNLKYSMYGCKYVECKKHLPPYEDWPKRFQWITNWYYAGDKAQSPPLYPSALPLRASGQPQEGFTGSDIIDLTGSEGSTVHNPIVL